MSDKTKMRAKLKGDFTEVKVLIKHPMTPKGKDRAGNVVKPHFIEEVTCLHNGEVVMSADWSAGVSANPYFAFQFEGGKKGDLVKMIWKDNLGNRGETVREIE